MRIVIDTNVFISSFFGGYPKQIIDCWKTGKVTLCLSNSILDEYLDVLDRMGFAEEKETKELLELFRGQTNSLFTASLPTLAVSSDPDDNKFIETAVALKAKCIVSGDKHLLVIKKYVGILIVNPRYFVETIAPVL